MNYFPFLLPTLDPGKWKLQLPNAKWGGGFLHVPHLSARASAKVGLQPADP